MTILADACLEKENCVVRLQAAASRKEKAVEQIAGSLEVAPGVYTFSVVLESMETVAAEKLSDARDEICSLAKVADSKNRENASYLELGLNLARSSLALVENICNPQTVYKKTGVVTAGNRPGRLLSKNY